MPYIHKSSALLLGLTLLIFSPFSFSAPAHLIITGSSTWEPFSFVDKNGKADGIMVDFWNLYAQKNNIKIEFHLLPWSESLHYTRTVPNAVHGGIGYTSDRTKFLAFSDELPLKPYHVYLFVQKDIPFQNLNSLHTALVGTVKESTKHAFLRTRISENNIKEFPTFGSLNDAAYRGEVDVFIDDLSTAIYDMEHSGNTGSFTPRRKLYSFPLHFAVGKDFKNNIPNIERGLENISSQEITAIYDKWLPENNPSKPVYLLNKTGRLTLFSFCFFLIFLVLIGYRRKLRFKTRELKTAVIALNESKEKFKTSVNIDALTGAKTRHYFFTHLLEKRFSSSPYLVAVLEVDRLENINDKYGQDIGDIALKHLVTQVRLHLPSSSIFARLVGGRFAISFEMHDISEAMQKLDRIRNALQLHPLRIDQQVISIQFQGGVAICPNESENGETLVQIATARMRAHKNNPNGFHKKPDEPQETQYAI